MAPNDDIEDLGVGAYYGDDGRYGHLSGDMFQMDYAEPMLQPVETDTPPRDDRTILRQALTLLKEAEELIATQRRRIAHLERLTTSDPLTGLLNRRGFDDIFRTTLQNAKRHGETGIIALIDFNRFKVINDTMGHAVGDALLRRFADVASSQVRSTDQVARLGGDEFAILLTRSTPHGGAARIREIKQHINRSSMTWNGRPIPLDVACGFVAYTAKDSAERLLELADRALYRDKGYR